MLSVSVGDAIIVLPFTPDVKIAAVLQNGHVQLLRSPHSQPQQEVQGNQVLEANVNGMLSFIICIIELYG